MLATTAIEGSAYGNLDPATLTDALGRMLSEVDGESLSAEARERPRTLKLPEGNQFARVFASRTDNNCWLKMVQFGERDYELEAILRVGAAYFESRFYSELRTRQQLGYIVFSGSLLYDRIDTSSYLKLLHYLLLAMGILMIWKGAQ